MIPATIAIGPVPLHLYGLIIGIAVVVGVQVSSWMARRHDVEERVVWAALAWVVVGGVVGARLYHVIDLWEYYALHLVEIGMVWRGGLGILGAVAGGLVGLWLFVLGKQRKRGNELALKGRNPQARQRFLELVDVGVFGLITAQIIGRLGNWVNQELYGLPTKLPWGIRISEQWTVNSGQIAIKHHPLFAYEMILNGIVLLTMLWLERKEKLPWGKGAYLAVYMVGYGCVRFALEYLRIEPWRMGPLTTAQWLSLSMIAGGGIWLYRVLDNGKR